MEITMGVKWLTNEKLMNIESIENEEMKNVSTKKGLFIWSGLARSPRSVHQI